MIGYLSKIMCKKKLSSGIDFNKEYHEYSYNGKELSGVTRRINERQKRKFSEDFGGEALREGIHVHESVEHWIKTGEFVSHHPDVMWIIEYLMTWHGRSSLQSEQLVTDYGEFSSAVDIVAYEEDGLVLYDMKRSFHRVDVTYQLSIYKYFIEKNTDYKVKECRCIAYKDREVYPVFPYEEKYVKELLYRERKNDKEDRGKEV